MRRDDKSETTIKGNDCSGGALMMWCSGYEKDKMETRLSDVESC
jgi:hypothetical protein